MQHDLIVRCLIEQRAKLLGYSRAILGTGDGAEDVLQDVCVLAISKSDQINDEAHLLGWLRVTCRNLARDLVRKRGRSMLALSDEVIDLLDDDWRRHDSDPPNSLQVMEGCIQKLNVRERELIRQRYEKGLNVDEIAMGLGRPAKSVFVSFSRINAKLADCIEQSLQSLRAANG